MSNPPSHWPRAIPLVDMNAFFASVERRDFPSLLGQPFAVTNGIRGSCVITSSYEARAHGVRTGMHLNEARRLCPDIIQRASRPQVYAGISTTTYYKWRERADIEIARYKLELKTNTKAKISRNEKKYVEFRDTIDHALSFGENMALMAIRSSFNDDWKSAAWYLERRFPDRWGRKVVGFSSDDGTKDFANAFANAIKEVEADEIEMSGKVVPIK
mgnify:CR=1 FL=1